MYGHLSLRQCELVRKHVAGRHVHDLGAGGLALSGLLLELGASSVVAVDKVPFRRDAVDGRIRLVESYFKGCTEEVEVAFISWPPNTPSALHGLIARTPLILYIGKNTDGSACGDPALWHELGTREVLDWLPQRRNELIIYGAERVTRDPLPEERAAADTERVWSYAELHDTEDEKSGPSS